MIVRALIIWLCMLYAASGSAQVTYPSADACNQFTGVPVDPGTTPTFPGHWMSLTRPRTSTGWSIQYDESRTKFGLIWFTFDQDGRPVWLATDYGAPTADGLWNQDLYRIRFRNQGTAQKTRVGWVSVRTIPEQPDRLGIRWQWDEVSAGAFEECISEIYRADYIRANMSYRGHWAEDTAGNSDPERRHWGYDVQIGALPDGSYNEMLTIMAYDIDNEPVWLTAQKAWAGAPPNVESNIPAAYKRGLFGAPSNHPDTCPTLDTCVATHLLPHDSVRRTYVSSEQGKIKLDIQYSNPITEQQVQFIRRTQGPTVVAVNTYRLTAKNLIVVGNTQCDIPNNASTCSVRVDWSANDTSARAFRRNKLTDEVAILFPASSTGSINDSLVEGRYQYELRSGSAEGTLLYESPEVVASPYLPGPAAAPSVQLMALPSQADLDASDLVASTPAKFRVDESGNATIRIPIYTPRGAGGLTPELAFSYGSGGGDGYLGWGWRLEGLSGISRCKGTFESGDGGNSAAICPTSAIFSDQLCLDGQRLIIVSGNHGRVGAIYRTELDGFTKVQVLSEVPNPGGSGDPVPMEFRTWGKDGSIRTYGSGTSRQMVFGRSTPQDGCTDSESVQFDAQYPLTWQLSKIEDRNQNQINFSYVGDSVTGEHYLSRISYLGGEVNLNYQPDLGQYKFFVGGATVTRSMRISNVEVNASAPGEPVTNLRGYQPVYQALPENPNRSRIVSLKECVGQSCRPATQFEWASAPALDGQTSMSSSLPNQGNWFSNFRDFKFGDIDGDGRTDIVGLHQATELKINFTRSNDQGGLTFHHASGGTMSGAFNDAKAWHLFDFDMDGRDDLFIARQHLVGPSQWHVYLSTGSGFSPLSVDITIDPSTTSIPLIGERSEAHVLDVDGDGLPDLFIPHPGGFRAYLMRRAKSGPLPYGFDGPFDVNLEYSCAYINMGAFNREKVVPADWNGDGRADLHFRVKRIFTGPSCTVGDPMDGKSTGGKESSGQSLIVLSDAEWEAMVVQDRGRARLSDAFPSSGSYPYYWVIMENMGQNGPSGPISFQERGAFRYDVSHLGFEYDFQVGDINGDGLSDILRRNPDTDGWGYALSLGTLQYEWPTGDSPEKRLWRFSPWECVLGGVWPNCPINNQQTGAVEDRSVRLMDYDGDGLLDFWRETPCPPGGGGCPDEKKYQVMLWNGHSFGAPGQAITTGFVRKRYDSDWGESLFDLDGDGYNDNLYFKIDNDNKSWHIRRRNSHHVPRNVIVGMIDGLGARIDIDYAPMSFSSVYRRDYDAPTLVGGRGSPIFDVGGVGSGFVVQYVSSSAPVRNSAAVPDGENRSSIVRYWYQGMKLQSGGRGGLGFRRVGSIDLQTGIETITSYRQIFPLTGLSFRTVSHVVQIPVDACLELGPETSQCMTRTPPCASPYATCDVQLTGVLKEIDDDWKWRLMNGTVLTSPSLVGQAPIPIFVARTRSLERSFDLTGAPVGATDSLFSNQDEFGNILTTYTRTYESFQSGSRGGWISEVETRSEFSNDSSSWVLGRLLRTTAHHRRPGETTRTKVATFGYHPGTGQLSREWVEPGGDSTEYLLTIHRYDQYGNRGISIQCSRDFSETACDATQAADLIATDPFKVRRYSRTTFDAYGRWPEYEIGPFQSAAGYVQGVRSQVLSRSSFGEPTSIKSANGSVADFRYGSFGGKYFERTQYGSGSLTSRRFCSQAAQIGAACPDASASGVGQRAVFVERKVQPGGGTQYIWFDKLGRTILTVKQGFDSDEWIAVQQRFDILGRVEYSSEPYFSYSPASADAGKVKPGGTIHWTRTIYDILGRPVSVMGPDGGTTSTVYSGLTATVTLPANKSGFIQQRHEVRNALNELISSSEVGGVTVYYSYDALGNLRQADRDGTITTVTFDRLGRKQGLDDPDTGQWTYQVNALGEQVRQIGPRGYCTETLNDPLGRPVRRRDGLSINCGGTWTHETIWTYDQTSYGAGAITSEVASEADGTAVGRTYGYDSFGRPSQVTTTYIDDRYASGLSTSVYTETTTFDQHGRVFQRLFDGTSVIPGLKLGELYAYNSRGYVTTLRDAQAGYEGDTYYEVLSVNERGQATAERRAGNPAMQTVRHFDSRTGRVRSIKSGTGTLQNLSYEYDLLGNVDYRRDQSGPVTVMEEFDYDVLQRLTSATLGGGSGSGTSGTQYLPNGNIHYKDGVGTYAYGSLPSFCSQPGEQAPGPHAVTSVSSGSGNIAYCYDAGGNQVRSSDGRSVVYTPFDLAAELRHTGTSGAKVKFRYGPGRERASRRDFINASATRHNYLTHYVGGVEVRLYTGGHLESAARYVGPVIVRAQSWSGSIRRSREFLFLDAQGSTYAVTNEYGRLIGPGTQDASKRMSFDAWGMRRAYDGGSLTVAQRLGYVTLQTTRRGYTGHEQVDGVGLIHMNGRMYDPWLGRFVQPDPIVQSPNLGQSWNRYTYVFNNPLAWTDPTGYLGEREERYLRAVVAIVIAAYTGYYIGPAGAGASLGAGAKTAIAVTGGFAAGGIATGTTRGAVIGAFTAGLTFGIGQSGMSGFWKGVSHSAAAGLSAELSGGKFGHGFMSAGLTQMFSPVVGRIENDYGRYAAEAIAGGTISSVTGGKFANGAVTAAFGYAFSSMAQRGVGGQREGASEQGAVLVEVGGSRPLTKGEIAMSKDVFGDDIDYSVPRVFRRTYAPVGQRRGVAVAPNGNIYFHPSDYVEDFSAQGVSGRAWFMHEMTHVWQHQQGVSVALRGIFNRRYEYLPLQPGKAFRRYGIEQQGDIVRDYYLLRQGYQVQGAPPISTYQSLLPFGR